MLISPGQKKNCAATPNKSYGHLYESDIQEFSKKLAFKNMQ
jgi:hypothetical protein